MSASSLPVLPIEIVTDIFKSTDNFSTATTLGRTCRGYQAIWKSNAASICYAILVRTITCFDEAFQYVLLQPLDTVSSEMVDETNLLAVKATEQFFKNADVAHVTLELYETQMMKTVYEATGAVLSATRVFFQLQNA